MDRIKLGECFNFNRRRRDIDMSTVPYIIISDFEKSSESDCIKMDNKNEKIYNSLLSKALRAEKTIENSGLSMNLEVPIPPHPNNRDRYILWKKRNVCRHVIEQSEAVIFLERNGYLLDKHYEPYQAIELCKEIKRQKGIKDPVEDKSRNFNNIYNKNDTNILRRKSMYGRESLKIRQKSYNYDEDSDDDFGFPNNRYIHKPSKQLSTASAPAISNNHSSSLASISMSTSAPATPSAPSVPSAPTEQPPSFETIKNHQQALQNQQQSYYQQSFNNQCHQQGTEFPNVDKCKPRAPPATRATDLSRKCSQSSDSDSFYPTLNI